MIYLNSSSRSAIPRSMSYAQRVTESASPIRFGSTWLRRSISAHSVPFGLPTQPAARPDFVPGEVTCHAVENKKMCGPDSHTICDPLYNFKVAFILLGSLDVLPLDIQSLSWCWVSLTS